MALHGLGGIGKTRLAVEYALRHEDEDEDEDGFFSFRGIIDGVRLEALIKPTGTLRYAFNAEAKGANLTRCW